MAIEFQRRQIFISTIVGRENYYRENNIYLIWILPTFSIEDELQTFTEKDISYNHLHNVFVFDTEAQQMSKKSNELFLTCYFRIFTFTNCSITSHWEKKQVSLTDLTFDHKLGVFYHDSEKERQALYLSS